MKKILVGLTIGIAIIALAVVIYIYGRPAKVPPVVEGVPTSVPSLSEVKR